MSNIKTSFKIETIQKLNPDEVQKLIVSPLEKKGFYDIKRHENCISATQNALLGKNLSLFITFPGKLGGIGENNADKSVPIVTNLRDEFSANSVYICSNNTISKNFSNSLNKSLKFALQYLDRDEIISLVDEVLPEFWRHEDMGLIKYEQKVINDLNQDNDLKRLKFPKENYSKLLNIFVEPRLV